MKNFIAGFLEGLELFTKGVIFGSGFIYGVLATLHWIKFLNG